MNPQYKDRSQWLMKSKFFLADGTLAATVTSFGGWLDLSARRIVADHERLLEALNSLPKTSDFYAVGNEIQCRI